VCRRCHFWLTNAAAVVTELMLEVHEQRGEHAHGGVELVHALRMEVAIPGYRRRSWDRLLSALLHHAFRGEAAAAARDHRNSRGGGPPPRDALARPAATVTPSSWQRLI